MEYHSGGSLPLLGRPRYCPGANANGGYLCETGHCCGESGCCTYYYELWWFWLLWTVLILFSCCCAYRHRRAKLRLQQQQRQRDISLLAYQGASSFPSSMLDLSFLASLKLPSYEEVAAQPSTPPPPYSSVFTAPRYPQPPRTAHPHLLSQQPGAPHRPLQPLSDGPSSLSSDNSSSCSCDSCCPSSPCSSSLSAPVTYETDTSHASTPSEATPLALDPLTVETVTAAAARLDPAAGSKDRSTVVSISIEQTDLTECVTKTSPDPDATFPVGITAPIKQQLDVTPTISSMERSSGSDVNSDPTRTLENTSFTPPQTFTLILDCVGGNVDKNPSLVPISVSPQNPPRGVPSDETHSFETEPNLPKMTPNTSPAQESTPSRTVDLTDTLYSPANVTDLSSPSQGIAHFCTKPAQEFLELTTEAPIQAKKHSEEASYSQKSPTTSQAPVHSPEENKNQQDNCGLGQTSELSKSTEMVATIANQSNYKLDTTVPGNLSEMPPILFKGVSASPELSYPAPTSSELSHSSKSQATISWPISPTAKLTQDPIIFSPDVKIEFPEPSQPKGNVLISMPDPSNSDCPTVSLSQDSVAIDEHDKSAFLESMRSSLQFYTEIPPLTSDPGAQPTMKANALDVISPTLDLETGTFSTTNLQVEQNSSKLLPVDSKLLNLEHSLTNLTQDPIIFRPDLKIDSSAFAEMQGVTTTLPEPPHPMGSVSISKSDHSNSECSTISLSPGGNCKKLGSQENVTSSLQFYTEIPPTPQATTKANSLDVISLTFDRETNSEVEPKSSKLLPVDSKLLYSQQPLTNLTQDSTIFSLNGKIESSVFVEMQELTTTPSILMPDSSNSECPMISLSQDDKSKKFDSQENVASSLEFYAEIPPLTPQATMKANSLDVVLPTFNREMNSEVEQNYSKLSPVDSKLLNLEQPLTNLGNRDLNSPDACSFPAITIHADPPSFAASPCSIPSPSLAQTPPAAMLLLDPLAAALPPCDRSAASSGHASSLSPSPRNTQSPPKQTLFSPCVDVFQPVDPPWENGEEEESDQPAPDEEEDSDVAADESQYRHRRLTGDSGIEVCRCRMEDEEEKEENKDGVKKRSLSGGSELHDSVDCPVRSRSAESDALCNSETSSEAVAIPVETA